MQYIIMLVRKYLKEVITVTNTVKCSKFRVGTFSYVPWDLQ